MLAQLDWSRFERLFEPKVYASWLLHEHTRSLDLDFFILQSSLLSLLGSAGQGNYTATGAFLDSLIAHRRAAGLPALGINWCAWSEGGLATVSGARGEAMWSALGMKFVSPAVAMQMFDQLMHRDVDQIAIADAHWPTYAAKIPNPAFLSELLDRSAVAKAPSAAPASVRPNPAPIAAGRQQVLTKLQKHVMAELGFAEPIDPDRPLNEVGLDSLMSVKLANSLEKEFGIPIPIADLISGPTINQLMDKHLRESIAGLDRDFASSTATVAGPIPLVKDEASQPRSEKVGLHALRCDPWDISNDRNPCSGWRLIRHKPADSAAFHEDERHRLQALVQRHVMGELGFAEPLDPNLPLNDAGLDSLMAVKLANSLENETGVPVAVAELLKGPTINQLVDHLFERLATDEMVKQDEGGPATLDAAGGISTFHPRMMNASDASHVAVEEHELSCESIGGSEPGRTIPRQGRTAKAHQWSSAADESNSAWLRSGD